MALDEALDRLEIADLLVAYSDAVDARDWDGLDRVFTDDAVIDYTELGGIRGDLPTIKAFLASAMGEGSGKLGFQHMLGQGRIVVSGDEATAHTPCFNPMVLDVPVGERGDRESGDVPVEHVYFVGLWYRDRLVRTPDGWRILERYEERAYKHNRPSWAGVSPPPPGPAPRR
jgi:ketosteroid isomerase-like protein